MSDEPVTVPLLKPAPREQPATVVGVTAVTPLSTPTVPSDHRGNPIVPPPAKGLAGST